MTENNYYVEKLSGIIWVPNSNPAPLLTAITNLVSQQVGNPEGYYRLAEAPTTATDTHQLDLVNKPVAVVVTDEWGDKQTFTGTVQSVKQTTLNSYVVSLFKEDSPAPKRDTHAALIAMNTTLKEEVKRLEKENTALSDKATELTKLGNDWYKTALEKEAEAKKLQAHLDLIRDTVNGQHPDTRHFPINITYNIPTKD